MHRCLAAAWLAVALATPAPAQRLGSIEVGALARGTLFDPSLSRVTALGFGGRVGVYLAPSWLVEADLSIANADGLAGYSSTTYSPLHIRVNYLAPYADRGKMVLGLGVVRTHFGGNFGKSDSGVAGLLGLRIDLHHSIVARADGTMDFVPSPANGAGNNWNAGLQIGIGYLFGG